VDGGEVLEKKYKLFFTILDFYELQVNNNINTAMKSAINRPALGAWADDFCPFGQKSFFFCPAQSRGGTAMKNFEEIIQTKGLPRVGQTVRSKDYGTFWQVMEEKEVWQTIADEPQSGETRMVPAIYLSYWKINDEASPGVGKMMGFIYTPLDNTFALHWEIAS
jgi:hypothetical protein